MQTDVRAPGASGTKALLAHLRDHPDARYQRPRELADSFGVPEEFVVRVLEKTETQAVVHPVRSQEFLQEIYQIRKRLQKLRDKASQHPTTFVIYSTIFAEVLLWILCQVEGLSSLDLNASRASVNPFGYGALLPLCAVALQMALLFRKGMVRYALYGGFAYWVVGGIPLALLAWISSRGQQTSERIGECVLIVIAHLAVSIAYAVAGSLFSLAGEYRRVLRENRRVERMSRQELLERLFQLEARMEMARNEPERKVRHFKVTTFLKGRLLVSAGVSGFLFRLLGNLTIGTQLAALLEVKHGSLPHVAPLVLSSSIGLLNIAGVVWLSYIAPNITTALLVGLLYIIGETGSQLLFMPLHRDIHHLSFQVYLADTIFIPIGTMILALLSGFAATIQTKTLEEVNLQRNDEASLVAEQLKIQWRLAEHACSTTVMVVDVVRSTKMKEGEPPLEVEYSFGRFQKWIEDIAVSHGGSVVSTAGDGAVFSFTTCHNALVAANEIQRRMPAFNQGWNRLTTRFRCRIGMHMGEVQGEVGKIQFAHVIDIAAHLQKVAPAGGVAVTSAIVGSLGASLFVPLAVKSDGHDVFLAMNPTGL